MTGRPCVWLLALGLLTPVAAGATPPRKPAEVQTAVPAHPAPHRATVKSPPPLPLAAPLFGPAWRPAPEPRHSFGLFRHFNATLGPVPFGAPTAQEFYEVTTPQGFRTPAVNISALISYFRHRAQARRAAHRVDGAPASGGGKP